MSFNQLFKEIFLIDFERVYDVINSSIEYSYRKSILDAETTDKAMKKRKKYKYFKLLKPFYITIAFVLLVFLFIHLNDSLEINYNVFLPILGIISLVIYLITYYQLAEDVQSVSDQTKNEFLSNHEDFIFYLRPFDSDQYEQFISYYIKEIEARNSSEIIGIKTNLHSSFSEDILDKELKQSQGLPVGTIGMPKEAEHPYGFIRIYVSDRTWQEDVLELIIKAKAILILVADKSSCIWEIEQTACHIQKTVFIIEDQEHYNGVRKKLSDRMNLPPIPDQANESQHFVLYYCDGKFIFNEYDHTPDGYKKISYALLKTLLPLDANGFFAIIDQACKISYNIEHTPEDSLIKMKEILKKQCPKDINIQIRMDDCDLIDSRRFLIYFTLNDDLVDFNQVKHNVFPIQNYLIEQFLIESSNVFQTFVTFGLYTFEFVIESKLHHDKVLITIDSSTLEKRIKIHEDSLRYADWLRQR